MPVPGLKARLKQSGLYERAASLLRQRVSHAQFGEDVHLRSIYDRIAFDGEAPPRRGLIVDVGCYRPILLSNTYGFYRRGWRCMNIDPNPASKRLFDAVRPRDINLELAIGECEGTATLFMFGDPAVWNTLDAEAARMAAARTGVAPLERNVDMQRLETVISRHAPDLPFEILTIDAEGLDLGILRSANLVVNRPRMILVESHGMTVDALASDPVVRFLGAHDYRLFSWINPNLLFLRGDIRLHG